MKIIGKPMTSTVFSRLSKSFIYRVGPTIGADPGIADPKDLMKMMCSINRRQVDIYQ